MHPAPNELRKEVESFLHECTVLHLATLSAENPWCAAVYFAHRGRRFYFFSSPDSRHARQLQELPRAAGSISVDQADWLKIRGLQLSGPVRRVEIGVEKIQAIGLYLAKFPLVESFVARQHGAGHLPAGQLARLCMYCLDADEMVYTDNRRGFGWRTKLHLDD